jgi:hypothetical protein
VGQKLSLKGVNEDTVGIPIRRPLDRVGEIEIRLRTSSGFAPLSDIATTAYVVCLTFYRIPNEQ